MTGIFPMDEYFLWNVINLFNLMKPICYLMQEKNQTLTFFAVYVFISGIYNLLCAFMKNSVNGTCKLPI